MADGTDGTSLTTVGIMAAVIAGLMQTVHMMVGALVRRRSGNREATPKGCVMSEGDRATLNTVKAILEPIDGEGRRLVHTPESMGKGIQELCTIQRDTLRELKAMRHEQGDHDERIIGILDRLDRRNGSAT